MCMNFCQEKEMKKVVSVHNQLVIFGFYINKIYFSIHTCTYCHTHNVTLIFKKEKKKKKEKPGYLVFHKTNTFFILSSAK